MVDQDGFCAKCRTAVSTTDKFCAGCGHNLGGGVSSSSTSSKPKASLQRNASRSDFGIPKWGWRVIAVSVIPLVAILAFSNSSDSGKDLREDLLGWIFTFLGWILVAAMCVGLLWAVIIRPWYYRRGGPAEFDAELRAQEIARGATPTRREIELAKAHANTERLQDKMADKPPWFGCAVLIGIALAGLIILVLFVLVSRPPG